MFEPYREQGFGKLDTFTASSQQDLTELAPLPTWEDGERCKWVLTSLGTSSIADPLDMEMVGLRDA